MIVAGHETTANIIHFALVHLATNPASQRRLQRDLDAVLAGPNADDDDDDDSKQQPESWDYEVTHALQASMVGACINETLRLMPPVVGIPKEVSHGQDQVLTIDGEKHLLPRAMQIELTITAAQRNPRYWPVRPSRVTAARDDASDFVPERWFLQTPTDAGSAAATGTTSNGDGDSKEANNVVEGADTEDFGGFAGPDTSAQLYRPPRGAFIPFSDGARSCLGRRIAQVELLASLSVIFRQYSVELAVDSDDEEVASMGKAEKAGLYRKAQDSARATLAQASSRLTLKLHGGMSVPVRLVRRGEERFVDWVDAEED